MKKYGISTRILTVLLVLAMVMSLVPSTSFAAIGDIVVGENVGKTGLTGNIDTQDTISWPIKIFDYLNDGMLFEYANASDYGDISDTLGGAYGGGQPAPHFTGAQDVIGTDYTVAWGYKEQPYTYWLPTISMFTSTGAQVEAVNFKSPRHLRLVPYQNYTDDMEPWVMSDFLTDNGASYAKDEVRYAVIVYRTAGLEDGKAKLRLGLSTDWNQNNSVGYRLRDYNGDNTSVYYSVSADVELVANSDSWNYVIVDMKSGDLAVYWDNFSQINRVLVDFAMLDKTDSVDISHVAYFDTEFEAAEFGKDAVAFDNDPGEFLDSHVEYYSEGTMVAVSKPTTDSNGMDFSVSSGGGYDVSTYDTWTAEPTWYQYLGSSVGGVQVTEVDNGERSYVSVSNSENTTDRSIFLWQYTGGGQLYYVTLVYKTTGFTSDQSIGFYVRSSDGGGSNMATTLAGATKSATLAKSEDEWTTVTYAISDFNDGDYNSSTAYTQYGMYLPSCLTGSSNEGKSLDIAMVWLSTDSSEAESYGQQGADYMNEVKNEVTGSYTTTQKKWNTGNNVAFAMLYANQGGGWVSDGTNRGGTNTDPNGYFSYQIGMTYPSSKDTLGQNADRTTAKEDGYTVSDYIYLVNAGNVTRPFDTSVMDMGGYGLFNTFSSGIYTAGLLNSSLTTVTGTDGKTYRVPEYKEETVEYIAALLRDALRVAQTDASGNYNYNFVRGTANGEQYGYDDNGKAMDLASALRKQLNVVLPAGGGKAGSGYADLGDYAKMTAADKAGLIGTFSECKGNIETFVDAAYYLLMNLYVSDSYNQAQDEYSYLVLSQGTLTDGGQNAYIFDGGFTTGIAADTENTEEYRNGSQSAVVYDKELDTISLSSALSKDKVYFQAESATTRFPFLPVTDSEGVYAGETKSPYFLDDGRGVMGVSEEGPTFVNRNYNFAMASNGEFVYHYDESLYFEFEGDDDVYLFINGELVLDIGGAHSITNVSMDVNDYVDWARKVLANPSAYSDTQIARAKKLNLKDGEKYTFDFYYMERHGWGSNCRIATNIVVTDPTLATDKQAYQGTDVNGDPVEVDYGGIVDIKDLIGYSFAITNKGETKLHKLGFEDADIGINLTWDGGLQIYGAPTETTVTTTAANATMTISGLNGIVNLDGASYLVSAEGTEITVAEAGSHSLTLYQYEVDPSNPKNELYTDADVTIAVESSTQNVTVAGIRVSDKDGGHLDASDLIITVDGYASKADYDNGIAMDTIYIKGKSVATWKTVTDSNGTAWKQVTFSNSNGWSKVYAHYWSDSGNADSKWPGKEMTAGTDGWTVNIPVDAEYIIFNNHDENETDKQQTPDLELWDNGKIVGPLTNDELKNFLINLQDPNGQTDSTEDTTEEEAAANLYDNDGLWQNGTVKITGFYYKMTEQQQEENRFTNTVFTTGYKFKSATAPLKSQDRHRVYGLGSYEYYQWGSNTVHLDFETMWNDVLGVFSSPDESLYEQRDQIDALNGSDHSKLKAEVTDKRGDTLTASYNLYANGVWGTYDGDDKVTPSDPNNTIIYFKNAEAWNKDWTGIHAYYWSDSNTAMTKWPGNAMKETSTGSGVWYIEIPAAAENIIFNNGYSGMGNQTADIVLPETAYTAVKWNDTNRALEVTFNNPGRQIFYVKVTSSDPNYYQSVVIPVVFYVTETEDAYYVLDYGLATQTVSSAELLKTDDFLANYGMTEAEFLGYLTSANKVQYLGTFADQTAFDAALAADNINRVAFDDTYLSNKSYTAADGIFNLGSIGATTVNYSDGRYSLADGYNLSFTPNKIMNDAYSVWMAFRVYNPTVETWTENETDGTWGWTTSTFTPHNIGPVNTSSTTTKSEIDIHNEVQMLKKVTFLPATVVYYEDDFKGISYEADATITKVGDGSGSLTQGITAETPYGQDATYQGSANATMSGNHLSKIEIKEMKKVASFTFKGTGFEIISRTNAFDSASFYVNVKQEGVTDPVRVLPVITEYDNAGGKACAHANHSIDGFCTTCGESVEHDFQYSIKVSKDATKVIFNNGDGTQTSDITIVADGQWHEASGVKAQYMATEETDEDGNRTFYFDNSLTQWSQVKIHAWSDSGNYTGDWPGMTLDSTCSVCGGISTADTDYYLIGTINGAECGNGDNNWKDLTDYKFVDGKLEVEFTEGSYVGVKTPTGSDANGPTFNWYWTTSYCTDKSANLVLNGSEKLYVPGKVKVTFTLIENPDGSLTLSYTTAESEKFTTTKETVIYYDNSGSNWSFVNAYYWSDTSNPVEWPGKAMTKVEGTDNLYSYTLPAGVTYVIFNNGSGGTGNQTSDLNLSKLGNIYTEGKWKIYDASTGTITALPENTTTAASNGYEIHQVPVLRVDDLDYGTYTVEIIGVPTYSDIQVNDKGEVTSVTLKKTYLYLDGIRIYQPLQTDGVDGTHPFYYDAENGAQFFELRDLILEGNAAAAQYVKDNNKIYTGNLSWTENRNGELFDGTDYVGNRVNSVNDYMLVGPNNELYMNGNVQKQAVIFYVTEDTSVTSHTLQIAARAIDAGLFFDGVSTGAEASLYQGVMSGDSYAWKMIDTITSGTEQYYTIDYAACPYTEDETTGVRTYQVALHVRSGMASFSSIKVNGLNIVESEMSEPTTLTYSADGVLQIPTTQSVSWNFFTAGRQMDSAVYLDDEEPGTGGNESTGGDNGSTDNEGSEPIPPTGDVNLVPVILIALTSLAFVFFITRKKLVV